MFVFRGKFSKHFFHMQIIVLALRNSTEGYDVEKVVCVFQGCFLNRNRKNKSVKNTRESKLCKGKERKYM